MTQPKQFNGPVPEAEAEETHTIPGSRISTNGVSGNDSKESQSTAHNSSLPSTESSSPSESCPENETNKELRRLNRALRALSACNQAMAQAGSEPELLDQICDLIVRLGGYRMSSIAYAEQDAEKTVRPMANAGYDSGYLAKINVKWSDAPEGRGPAGSAIRENRICVIIDIANDPTFAPWRAAARERGYAAVIALPLRVAGQAFGVLAIYSEQASSFESSEVELLAEIADNLSYGITAIRAQAESQRATAALREAELKYRQLVEQMPAISYLSETGALGGFVYLSPQTEMILGYSVAECLSDPRFWWDHLNPEDRPTVLIEDRWEEGIPFQLEYRMRRQDGGEIWIRDEGMILRNPESGQRMTRGVMIDITERKRTEEALRLSEENYRRFVAQSSEGIFRVDLHAPLPIDLPEDELVRHILHDCYIGECNDAMARMYGLQAGTDMLGKRLSELATDPNIVELTRTYIRAGFRLLDRESHELDFYGKPKVFLNSAFGIVEQGKLLRMWGIQRDITERLKTEEARQKAEEALRESEERYRAFVTQSSEGIFRMEYDPPVPCHLPVSEQLARGRENGRLAECNDAMAKMYGLGSAKELIGKRLADFLILKDPITRQFMEKFVRNGYRITDQESREVDAHGQKKIFRNSMMGMVVDGHWVRTWGIARDVTERLHLEEQLRNAQQLEAIGRLAGGVAHDFNNILGIIMGHGELLLARSADEQARNGVAQIRRAAERAASLTQQLLAFSRKQVLQPKVLDLNEAVADIQKMLARVIGEDIELIASLHPSLVPVKADPGQVEQVLMNLAINARDAMPQGGKLVMETSNLEVSAERGKEVELPAGRYVMLKVTDSGQGMDRATLTHIFEPFFTTKSVGKGTGLGLATVYGIVKQSGGSIQAQSEPGQGTEFRIYLPAADGAASAPRKTSAGEQVPGGTETILVTEDQADLRELTRIFLEEYGYKVLEASSAQQAMQIVEIFPGRIHLLLTDVIMPRMSGRQLAEQVLRGRPDTKIMYMTGYTDDMVVQHKVLEPGVKLLQKPFTKLDLALKVRSTLDGK